MQDPTSGANGAVALPPAPALYDSGEKGPNRFNHSTGNYKGPPSDNARLVGAEMKYECLEDGCDFRTSHGDSAVKAHLVECPHYVKRIKREEQQQMAVMMGQAVAQGIAAALPVIIAEMKGAPHVGPTGASPAPAVGAPRAAEPRRRAARTPEPERPVSVDHSPEPI
jgi:hypothetical protein